MKRISKLHLSTFTAISIVLVTAGTSEAASVVFDNISNYENGVSGAGANSTASVPNTYMGDAYTLAPGTASITEFDIYPVNLSGTSYTGLSVDIYVWDTVNMSTVNATTPAFGNLLGWRLAWPCGGKGRGKTGVGEG